MGKQTIRLFPPFFHSAPPCSTGRGNTPHPQPFIYTVHSYICRQYLSSTQPVTEITTCTRYPTKHECEPDRHKHSESHRATVAPAGTGFHHTHNTPRRNGSDTFAPAHPTYPDGNRRQYPGMHPCLAAQTRPATPARHDGICYRKLQKKIARITAPCRHLTFINTQPPLTHHPQPSITCQLHVE